MKPIIKDIETIISSNNLVLTPNEIIEHVDDLLYYSIWSLYTTEKQDIYLLSSLSSKRAYVKHRPRVASLGASLAAIVPVQLRTWRDYLVRYNNLTFEEKQAEQLIIISGETMLKVVKTIIESGASPRSWTIYFRVWCYIYCAIAGEEEHQISQQKTSEILKARYNTVNRIFLDLINMGLIERKGWFFYSQNKTHSYSYAIPETLAKKDLFLKEN